jgi:membrane-associated phospholipid phosphatase
MGFTLIYFGEHYAVDVLAGWLYAVVAYASVEWFVRRRATRRESVPGPTPVAGLVPLSPERGP